MELNRDPLRELSEIRNQLSYSKTIGVLFGAGTSKATGISDITELTKKIENGLEKDTRDDAKDRIHSYELFSEVMKELNAEMVDA